QDGVGFFAELDGGLRHRRAGVAIMAGARRRLGEAEFEPRGCCRDLLQHRERGRHDLRSNAVTRQYRDVERVVGEHVMFSVWFGKSEAILAQRAPQAPDCCQPSVSTGATTALILNCPLCSARMPGLTHVERRKSE